jgi:hypothetical protein
MGLPRNEEKRHKNIEVKKEHCNTKQIMKTREK